MLSNCMFILPPLNELQNLNIDEVLIALLNDRLFRVSNFIQSSNIDLISVALLDVILTGWFKLIQRLNIRTSDNASVAINVIG